MASAPAHVDTSCESAVALPPAASISATTCRGGVGVDVVDRDVGALGGQQERLAAADAAAGPGHDRGLAVQSSHAATPSTFALFRDPS